MDTKNQIVIYNSYTKALELFLLCSLFVFPSIWMVSKTGDVKKIFYFCIFFFGTGCIMAIFNFFDRRPKVIITEKGITDVRRNIGFINWDCITSAYILTIYSQPFICLRTNLDTNKTSAGKRWYSNLNKAIGAQDINIGLGLLKVNNKKILAIINDLITAEDHRSLVISNYINLL